MRSCSQYIISQNFLELTENRTPLSPVFLDFRDPLWPEFFGNLAVGPTFYPLQDGQQRFLKFDP